MKRDGEINNQMKAIRLRLGLSQQELAQAAGIARQTISGMEAGLYSPSASVALKLARALRCTVEDIFWLEDDEERVEARACAGFPGGQEQRLMLARVGSQWVAHPLIAESAFRMDLAPADGVGRADETGKFFAVRLLDDAGSLERNLLIAGCAPMLSLWTRSAERWHPETRVHWMHANSMRGLNRLAAGEVHAAGIHLCDPAKGESNASFVRRVLPEQAVTLVTMGVWEEGFAVPPGNPKGLRSAEDLPGGTIRIVNRESGSGSRLLLDSALGQAGIPAHTISGYGEEVQSHQAVAYAVAQGIAYTGVTTESVAALYDLDFVPIRQVRYDLALLETTMQQETVRQLLSTLQHRWIRSQFAALKGFDTAETGVITAVPKA